MGAIKFEEILRQPYADDSYIASGLVDGHPVDTIYLEFGNRPGERTILMRPDEAAAVIWALGGALYSYEMREWESKRTYLNSDEEEESAG